MRLALKGIIEQSTSDYMLFKILTDHQYDMQGVLNVIEIEI